MYQEERLKKIIEWLREDQVLSNQELMERLEISRDTARRDIIRLTKMGKAIRTHGGIARADFQVNVEDYRSRLSQNVEGKERIGKKAAQLLPDQGICFFDVSTMMQFVCMNLSKELTVYTHSLDNLELMTALPRLKVHCLGGILNKDNRFFYGCDVWENLNRIYFNVALLSAAAVAEDGIYFENEEDAQVKRIAAKRSNQVIVMADYQKFQRVSKFCAIGWEQIDLLILDREPSMEWKQHLEKEKVQWIVV